MLSHPIVEFSSAEFTETASQSQRKEKDAACVVIETPTPTPAAFFELVGTSGLLVHSWVTSLSLIS